MVGVPVSAFAEALDGATAEQRAALFQYASREWYGRQPICRRASHLMTCLECGKLYIEHPLDKTYPYLNKLCSGDLVKL